MKNNFSRQQQLKSQFAHSSHTNPAYFTYSLLKSLTQSYASLILEPDSTMLPDCWSLRNETSHPPQKDAYLRTVTQIFLHMDCLILLQVRFGTSLVRLWFGVVPNLAIDMLLSTSVINHLIQSIFSSEQKVVPWHSHPVAILTLPNHLKS